MTTQFVRSTQKKIYFCALILLGSLGLVGGASAAGCPPSPLTGGESATISTTCDDLVLVGAGNLQIQSLGVVSATTDIAVNNSGITNSISNYGAVRADIATTADAIAIYNTGTISVINNSGTAIITGTSSSGVGAAGVANNGGTITTLTNSGTSEISGIATNTGARYGIGVANQLGTIGTLNNQDSAVIKGETTGTLNAFGVFNVFGGTIDALNNSGLAIISGKTTGSGSAYGVLNNGGTITTLNNSGAAIISAESTGSGSAYGVSSSFFGTSGDITTLNNSGSSTISATSRGAGDSVGVEVRGSTIGTINNAGSATISGISTGTGNVAGIQVLLSSTIGTINNSGTISAESQSGLSDAINNSGNITTLVNSGTIIGKVNGTTSTSTLSSGVYNEGDIATLTNTGVITAIGTGPYPVFSIENNRGTIGVLNNAQGGNGSSPSTTALTYYGNLPTNYNVIINSATHYGQLAVTYPVGTIANFGIYGAPFLTSRTYSSVLSGTALPTGTSSGAYDNMTWALVANGTDAYDLTFTGASLVGTQQSLVNTANALAPVYALQNATLVNSFTYDCTLFDVNNICISVGGRNTQVSAANGLNNTSALLIAAYRPHPNYRIGAYADQNLSVNNAGSTVNLSNNTPLIGIFGAWTQNQAGTGAEVRVSAAYGQKDATINRQVVGLSEPGSGSSTLNSQGAQITAKYGFDVTDKAIVSPYVGVRYTQNNMGSYTEGASSSVTSPLTYSALNTNATTALAGLGASYKIIPTVTTFASAGVETDTNTSNGTYSATGINGLTPVNFNPNPVRTRPTATLGAYYDIAKNQRFGVTGIYRQEAYQAVSSTTVMATYTIGL